MEKYPIVLVHGFGEDSHIFQYQREALQASGFEVFIPNLPGTGQNPVSPVSASITGMATWLQQWINEQTQAPVILLGHSMGGYITLAFAENYPEKIAGFGLLHSTAYADSDEKKEARGKAIDFITQNGAHAFLQTIIPGLFGSAFLQEYPEIVGYWVERARSFRAEALIAYYKAMIARPDRTDVLRQSAVPVLMIAGEEDKAVPLADLSVQAAMATETHFHVHPRVGHMGMLENSEIFTQQIRDFAVWVNSK